MNPIKTILLTAILATSMLSCNAQTNKNMDFRIDDKYMLNYLYENVQYCDSSVSYFLNIHIGLCAFEVFVNDMPVYRYDGNDGTATVHLSAPINTNILKSGTQTWQLRLYPPIVNKKRLEELPENRKIELSVEAVQFDDEGSMRRLSPPVTLFSTSGQDDSHIVVDARVGKSEANYHGTFEATVPYELTGWSRSKDLTIIDSTQLKTQLVAAYEAFRQLIEKGKLDEIARRIFPRERETAQCLYYNKAKNDDYMNVFLKGFGQEKQKPYPLENYKMVFFGNGRMVTLERTDMWFEPALATQYFINGEEFTNTYYLYFHIPEGKEELEVIR